MSLDPSPSDAELRRKAEERRAKREPLSFPPQPIVPRTDAVFGEAQQQRDAVAELVATGRASLSSSVYPDWHPEPGNVVVRPVGPKYRSKLEAAYADRIAADCLVDWWRHEPVRLRLANGAWFKPDFLVWANRGTEWARLELHEVKGFWREAARVRIKVAAELYPMFTFVAVTRTNGVWQYERFQP